VTDVEKLAAEIEEALFRGKADFSNESLETPESHFRFIALQPSAPPWNTLLMNLMYPIEPVELVRTVCECGAYKATGATRGPDHSSWCPWSKAPERDEGES
jgi:hypothetical protein